MDRMVEAVRPGGVQPAQHRCARGRPSLHDDAARPDHRRTPPWAGTGTAPPRTLPRRAERRFAPRSAGASPAAGDLVVIYPSVSYDLEALHAAAIEEAAPAAVVGCTTVGAFTRDVAGPGGLRRDARRRAASCPSASATSSAIATTSPVSPARAAETARDRAGEERYDSALLLLCDA